MRTAGEIAQRALIRAGIVATGETPTAAEISDAVTTLSDMLDSWGLEKLIVFGPAEYVVPLLGQERFTIGPSGDVVTERPNLLLSAFSRIHDSDTEVKQASPAFMDAINRKDIGTDACWLSFQAGMPNATIRLWPVQKAGSLHITVTQPVVKVAEAYDELDLPPGWYHAMVLNLAVQLCEEYGFAVTPTLITEANNAKASIKRPNIQPAYATFDRALL